MYNCLALKKKEEESDKNLAKDNLKVSFPISSFNESCV